MNTRPDYVPEQDYEVVVRQKADHQPAFWEYGNDGDDDNGSLPLGVRLHGAPQLHQQGFKGKGLKIGVIDNGIDTKHPLFQGKVVKSTSYRYGSDVAEDTHGTHVAGTIHMMAPEAEIYDYRVFGPQGKFTVSEAIAHAVLDALLVDGCDIINMSIGSPTSDMVILSAIAYVKSKGMVVVAAASNNGDGDSMTNDVAFPAFFEETISIAAVKKERGLPAMSYSSSNPQVDYAAVGDQIKSYQAGGSGYATLNGTSMACPHVTGLIAALMSGTNSYKFRTNDPGTDQKVRDLLKQYTIDIGLKGFDTATGLGFVTFLSKDEFNTMFKSVGVTTTTTSRPATSRNGLPAIAPRKKVMKKPRGGPNRFALYQFNDDEGSVSSRSSLTSLSKKSYPVATRPKAQPAAAPAIRTTTTTSKPRPIRPVGAYSNKTTTAANNNNDDESSDSDDDDDEQDPDDASRTPSIDMAELLKKSEPLSIPGFNKFLIKTGTTPSRPTTPEPFTTTTTDEAWPQDIVDEAPKPSFQPSFKAPSSSIMKKKQPVIKPKPKRFTSKGRSEKSATVIEVDPNSHWS
mmetsp:Transcript_31181/g.47560  ORF Transcript_31181/g.47560 Transcript_31181/m.47560 type:complete len:569 (+) Transcript_31181:90-1796(+)